MDDQRLDVGLEVLCSHGSNLKIKNQENTHEHLNIFFDMVNVLC